MVQGDDEEDEILRFFVHAIAINADADRPQPKLRGRLWDGLWELVEKAKVIPPGSDGLGKLPTLVSVSQLSSGSDTSKETLQKAFRQHAKWRNWDCVIERSSSQPKDASTKEKVSTHLMVAWDSEFWERVDENDKLLGFVPSSSTRLLLLLLKNIATGLVLLYCCVHMPHKAEDERESCFKDLAKIMGQSSTVTQFVVVSGEFNATNKEIRDLLPVEQIHVFNERDNTIGNIIVTDPASREHSVGLPTKEKDVLVGCSDYSSHAPVWARFDLMRDSLLDRTRFKLEDAFLPFTRLKDFQEGFRITKDMKPFVTGLCAALTWIRWKIVYPFVQANGSMDRSLYDASLDSRKVDRIRYDAIQHPEIAIESDFTSENLRRLQEFIFNNFVRKGLRKENRASVASETRSVFFRVGPNDYGIGRVMERLDALQQVRPTGDDKQLLEIADKVFHILHGHESSNAAASVCSGDRHRISTAASAITAIVCAISFEDGGEEEAEEARSEAVEAIVDDSVRYYASHQRSSALDVSVFTAALILFGSVGYQAAEVYFNCR